MPFRSRALSLRPVNSEKHEITWSLLSLNASGTQVISLIKGVQNPTASDEVQQGSTVGSVYFETNLNGVDNSGTVQIFHWMIVKSPSNEIEIADADPALYNQKIKRHILKRGMEMLPEIPIGSGGTVQTKRIFVVKLPKSIKRFGVDDRLNLYFKSTSASGVNFCGIAIYKNFS